MAKFVESCYKLSIKVQNKKLYNYNIQHTQQTSLIISTQT